MGDLDGAFTSLRIKMDAAKRELDQVIGSAPDLGFASQSGDVPEWNVRFTWEIVRGFPHPKYTYERRESESRAIDCAVSMIDHYTEGPPPRLIEVHVKGPGRFWVKVE